MLRVGVAYRSLLVFILGLRLDAFSPKDIDKTYARPLQLISLRTKALRASDGVGLSDSREWQRSSWSMHFASCVSSKSQGSSITKAISACRSSMGMSEGMLCSWWLEHTCAQAGTSMSLGQQCSGVDRICQSRAASRAAMREEAKGALIESNATLRRRAREVGRGAIGVNVTQKPLMFMHIPKNAGTAVEQAGQRNGIEWGRNHPELSFLRPMPTGEYCMRYHVPPTYLTHPHLYEESETFCITRHPHDRAVSEYTYLLGKEWAKEYIFLHDKPACTAEGLNYFVQMTLRRVQQGWKFHLDCHMLPQSEWIWDVRGKKWCDNVLKLEELPGAFDTLMEQRGSSLTLSKEKENSSGGGACYGLTVKDLDNVSREMIENVYFEDFERLGYAFE